MKYSKKEIKMTAGKWVQYKTQSDCFKLKDSLKGRHTGWESSIYFTCTTEEGFLNPNTFERKLYFNCFKSTVAEKLLNSEYHIYYSNNNNKEAKNPRILLELINGEISKIRGIDFGQNLDPYMVNILEEKLRDICTIENKYVEIILDIKTLNNIEKKHNSGDELTSDELVFLYQLKRPIKSFGVLPDKRIFKITNERGDNIKPIETISIELGYGLSPLIDKEYGSELLNRIKIIRDDIVKELGLLIPRVCIVDNMMLKATEYCIKIKGARVAKGIANLDHYLVINPGGKRESVPGTPTTDPTFKLPAKWINKDIRENAEKAGYTVVDTPSIIATHLNEVICKYANEIIGRQEVLMMINSLHEDYPVVVDEVNKEYQIGDILKVLQGLLVEQVSIIDIVSILETLCDFAGVSKDTGFLIEKVRQRLKRQICQKYVTDDNILYVITVEPSLQKEPGCIANLLITLEEFVSKNIFPVLLCSEKHRTKVLKMMRKSNINDLAVISDKEISDDVEIKYWDVLGLNIKT